MDLKYNSAQHQEYLIMQDNVASQWLKVFDGNATFYVGQYWDLFTKVWRAGGPITKTEALKCMTGIKSAHTAGKYLETAINEGLLVEEDNPEDKRSKFISLSPLMKQRLDTFFDRCVSEVRKANKAVDIAGPSPVDP